MNGVKKAVITTAGMGTRFLPATKAVPKSMLPIVDRPILDYIIDEAAASGMEEAIVVIGSNAEVIEKHFERDAYLEERLKSDKTDGLLAAVRKITDRIKITFVTQEEMNGLAGALLYAEKAVGNEPFALLLGDEIIYTKADQKPCIRQLCDVYEKTEKTVIATMRVSDKDVEKYGNIGIAKDGAIKEVNDLAEKPKAEEKLSNYAIIGRYVLAPGIFDEIRKLKKHGNEIILTDAFCSMAKRGEIVASEFEGTRYDVGDKSGYVQANVAYALRDPSIGSGIAEFIGKIREGL